MASSVSRQEASRFFPFPKLLRTFAAERRGVTDPAFYRQRSAPSPRFSVLNLLALRVHFFKISRLNDLLSVPFERVKTELEELSSSWRIVGFGVQPCELIHPFFHFLPVLKESGTVSWVHFGHPLTDNYATAQALVICRHKLAIRKKRELERPSR